MTLRQKKGIRTAVLAFLLLLLAVGTFDSPHGYLSAQAEPSDTDSGSSVDLRRAEADPTAEGLTAAQTPPRIVEVEKVVEVEKIVEKEVEVPVEVEKVVKVVKYVQVPEGEEPASSPWESMDQEQDDDPPHIGEQEPVLEPEPRQDHDTGPVPGPEPDTVAGAGDGAQYDRNKGHGNDEDGYDEDNPGRGGFGGVGTSSGRGGHGGSGGGGGSKGKK